MENMFEMSDLGQMSYFLGMEVSQTEQGIFLSQKAFSLKILNKFSMLNCKQEARQLLLEKSYHVKVILRRFMHCCNGKHLQAAKRFLRYIKGTLSFGVKFTKVYGMKLLGYADSDWPIRSFEVGLHVAHDVAKEQRSFTNHAVAAEVDIAV
ncbi:uncharacterized mitochondrial protein AtMg00810-like [Gossypium hirsutum]|uniref:Uncharacterized mitochondrial protein AtMg00810-like n=1 Tax=Gossypium hirsutum TaxID=3635 RepID=A0ABM2YND1_GOSHI|nr:uncharacterized mitochondrial protein AtMg00810-like [Gossypium hirsutum]